MTSAWPWIALVGLGAFHGLNPAMGWLFAVALGLQSQSRAALLWALIPIAAGHALAIVVVVIAVGVVRALVDLRTLQIGAAVLLVVFGLNRLLTRHRARVGMQVGSGDLLIWSFLMATAHGAGLMLIPVLLEMPVGTAHHEHGHMTDATGIGGSAMTGVAAVVVHTAAMLVTAGVVALAVYQWAGLAFLRRGWINLDLLWVIALVGAGLILLIAAIR